MNLENISQDLILSNYSIKDIKSYAQLFFAEKEERLKRIIDRISSDMKINYSELDFSDDSLVIIDRWLVNHVECVKLSKEEHEVKRKSYPAYIEISDWKFSLDTHSDIVNIGMYFGETIIRKYPNLKWEQHIKGSKRNVNYGHMIIKLGEMDYMEINPIWLVGVIFTKIINKKETSLSELFRKCEELMEI